MPPTTIAPRRARQYLISQCSSSDSPCYHSGLTHSVMRATVFLSDHSQRFHGLGISLLGPHSDRIRREIAVSIFTYFTYWFRRRDGNNSWDMNVVAFFHSFVGRIILEGVAAGKAFEGLH